MAVEEGSRLSVLVSHPLRATNAASCQIQSMEFVRSKGFEPAQCVMVSFGREACTEFRITGSILLI